MLLPLARKGASYMRYLYLESRGVSRMKQPQLSRPRNITANTLNRCMMDSIETFHPRSEALFGMGTALSQIMLRREGTANLGEVVMETCQHFFRINQPVYLPSPEGLGTVSFGWRSRTNLALAAFFTYYTHAMYFFQ